MSDHENRPPSDSELSPIGGSELGALIRSYQWVGTVLGPIEAWPPSLLALVHQCLVEAERVALKRARAEHGALEPAITRSENRSGATAQPASGPEGAGFASYLGGEDARAGARGLSGDHHNTLASVQERLQESNLRYELVARATYDTVWDWNLVTNDVTWNEAIHTVFGYHRDVMQSDAAWWYEHIHPDDRERIVHGIHQAIDDGEAVWSDEYRYRLADGSHTYVADRGSIVRDEFGRATRMVGAMQDISDRMREQAASVERERRFQGLAAAVLAMHTARSVDEPLRIAADRAREIIGAHQSLIILNRGSEWSQPITITSVSDKYGAPSEKNRFLWAAALQDLPAELNLAFRMTQAELEKHPVWQAMPKEGASPPMRGWLAVPIVARHGGCIGSIQLSDRYEGDFTAEDEVILRQLAQMAATTAENARLGHEREQLVTNLQEADRRKDEFLAVLSHELRSPLNVIIGNIELLREEQQGTKDYEDSLDAIDRNVRAQTQLIADLLDVSRIITGKMLLSVSLVDVQSLLNEAVETIRFAAESKGVHLLTRADEHLGMIVADKRRMQQVFWNLLSNAVKFTAKGGSIMMTAKKIDSGIEFRIRDTGLGINPAFLPYVFDRFHQEDASKTRKHGGLGLGLAIVRHITELHGGTVRAESEGKGKGAAFTVWIPVYALRGVDERSGEDDAEAGEAPDAATPLREPSGALAKLGKRVRSQALAGLKLLVIDDQEEARKLLDKTLSRQGADVHCASLAEEALKLQHDQPFDALVCDIGMPEMNGHEFIKRWRAHELTRPGSFTPAIALTAYASDQDRLDALAAGFQLHLAKPVRMSILVRALRELGGRDKGIPKL